MKVGQRWWVPAAKGVWAVEEVKQESFGQYARLKSPVGALAWVEVGDYTEDWQLLAANQVYQHGDELFVSIDETGRLRNLRTGLTIRPRVPFKYLGEMPQVGQVWRSKSNKWVGTVCRIEKNGVALVGLAGIEVYKDLGELLKYFTPLRKPNFHFFTGHRDGIKVEHQDRRFTAAEVGVAVPVHMEDALTRMSHKQHAWWRLKKYCMADVEATVRDSVSLYMAPDGAVWRYEGDNGTHVRLNSSNRVVSLTKVTFAARFKALPLPGQLWAKGSRYVTVDRVEDGRVYYTGGSSGLRRFLNEYARVTIFTGRSPNVQQIKKAPPEFGTSAPVHPRPFLTSNRTQEKLEELARGYKSSKTLLMQQMIDRALRPEPAPFRDETLEKLNSGTKLEQLAKWARQLSLSATKLAAGAKHLERQVEYANQRIKELSK